MQDKSKKLKAVDQTHLHKESVDIQNKSSDWLYIHEFTILPSDHYTMIALLLFIQKKEKPLLANN